MWLPVASGTAALQLGCALIDLRPGDEVVLPSLTFAATAAAVVQAGATPVFADVRGVEEREAALRHYSDFQIEV